MFKDFLYLFSGASAVVLLGHLLSKKGYASPTEAILSIGTEIFIIAIICGIASLIIKYKKEKKKDKK